MTRIIPPEDRKRYTDYYFGLLKKRLNWAIDYVRENPQPVAIQEHMQVWLRILGEFRRPELHSSAITLIALLHPWPLNWGYWAAWEQELSFAAKMAPSPEQKAQLLTYLADMIFLTGRREAALDFAKQAFSYACLTNAIIPLARSGTIVSAILLENQERQAATDVLNTVEQEIAKREVQNKLDNQVVIARACMIPYKARWLRLEGRWDTALALLNGMIDRLESIPLIDPHKLADCYSTRSVFHWLQGESLSAIGDLDQAINLVSQAGYKVVENGYRGNLGLYYWAIGELKQAEKILLSCIRMAEQSRIYYRQIYDIGNLALVFLSQGRIQDALVMSERHLDLAKDHSSPAEKMRALDNYAIVKFYSGDYLYAQVTLEQNIPIYENQTVKTNIIIQLVNISRCYIALDKSDLAISAAEKAYNYAEQQSYPAAKIIALRCLAEIRRSEQSKQFLQQALILARQCHHLLDEAACLLSLAGTEADENEQTKLWQEGSQILDQIGASAWLEGCFPKHPPKIPLVF